MNKIAEEKINYHIREMQKIMNDEQCIKSSIVCLFMRPTGEQPEDEDLTHSETTIMSVGTRAKIAHVLSSFLSDKKYTQAAQVATIKAFSKNKRDGIPVALGILKFQDEDSDMSKIIDEFLDT